MELKSVEDTSWLPGFDGGERSVSCVPRLIGWPRKKPITFQLPTNQWQWQLNVARLTTDRLLGG